MVILSTCEVCDYNVVRYRRGTTDVVQAHGRVEGHRRHALPIYVLVKRAHAAAGF